jgi:chromosome segregation ATPase
MTEVPVGERLALLGERLAALETESRARERAVRDIWDSINELRKLLATLPVVDAKIDQIKAMCEEKRHQLNDTDDRVTSLETRAAASAGERNVIMGIIAVIGSIIGGVVTWGVTHALAAIKA